MTEEKKDKTKVKKTLEEKLGQVYQKKTQREHVYDLPDTYVGSIISEVRPMWVYNDESDIMELRDITYNPGLFKIYDEAISNTYDHHSRDKTCKTIRVSFDKSSGMIEVFNDGNGVPVVIHPEHKIYIPELIFGHMLTGQSYSELDSEVCGRNGMGIKLNCIFSKLFILETVYINKKEKVFKKYVQKFKDNLLIIEKADITNVDENTSPYTKITFYPDYEKFGLKGMTNDILALFKKRVYDISVCTDKRVTVYLNDKKLKVKSFEDFIKMHYIAQPKTVFAEVNDKWRIGVVYDPDNGGNQVSFVNGNWTFLGGTHVEYIADQITKKVIDHIKSKKDNKNLVLKSSQVRDHLTFFIDCNIVKPSFSSQTKGEMTKKKSEFGSECDLSPGFIKKVIDTGLAEMVTRLAIAKANTGLKTTDGKRVSSIKDIPKLHDAHLAGTRKSKECSLILTEGDSALSFAISGIKVLGRDKFGAFPLKGKLLNVRNARADQIKKNQEFINLKRILGLKQDTVYHDVSKLRYGKIIILTDQDADGSHIKGLIMNMFQYFWPELLQIDGFIQTLSTPLVKVWKKTDAKKANPKVFFTMTEYEHWVEGEIKNGNISKWGKPKYYKGLGTSSEKEAKEIFSDFLNRIVSFIWEKYDINGVAIDNQVGQVGGKKKMSPKSDDNDEDNNDENNEDNDDNNKSDTKSNNLTGVNVNKDAILSSKSYDRITLAFDENKADLRKGWLNAHNKENVLEYDKQEVTYSEFVDKELIHFSKMDNERSIPSITDSFKPSHRKILFALLKKNQKSEIKVAQLASYVAEHTAYKHGEKSMEESIVNMGQRFVGSNNIYLLHPCGNFGYRRMGGAEHASSRYIFTYLDPITRKIFIEDDDCILKYLEDEGDSIEPECYYPIIPMILVNGTKGIGTGWSTDVPHFNIEDICKNLIRKLDGKEMKMIHPWYYGFNGEIEEESPGKYKVSGKFEVIDRDTVRVTEIPVKGGLCWIEDYSEFVKSLIYDEKLNKNGRVYDIKSDCGNNEICIDVIFRPGQLQSMIKNSIDGKEEIEKYLKLSAKLGMTNMWLYNTKGVITHYKNPIEIMEEFYEFRLEMYTERKKHHLRVLNNELEILKNKIRFLNDYRNKVIVLDNKLKVDVIAKVKSLGYPKLSSKLDAIDPPNDNEDLKDIINVKGEKGSKGSEVPDDEPDLKKEKGVSYKSYEYITSMQLFSLTKDKLDDLVEKMSAKQKEVDDYNATPEKDFWRRELQALTEYYPKWVADRELEEKDDDVEGSGKKKKAKKDKKDKDDEDDERPKKVKKNKTKQSSDLDSDEDEKPKKVVKSKK